MKGRNLFLTAIIAIIIGVAMLFFNRTITGGKLVTVGGIIFIVAGILNMISLLGGRDNKGESRQGFLSTSFGWATSAAAVLLGLCMLIFHDRFVELVTFMFAVLVGVAALYQIFLLIFGARPTRLPNWLFIAPILLVGAAVYLFIPSVRNTDSVVMIVTGGSFALFGVALLIEAGYIGHKNHLALKAAEAARKEVYEEPSSDKKTEKKAEEAEDATEPKSLDEANK